MMEPPRDVESEPLISAADLVEANAEPAPEPENEPAEIEASADATVAGLDDREVSAMADPENAHSPMSPDDRVSNEHTGLHTDEHSTGGPTPPSWTP